MLIKIDEDYGSYPTRAASALCKIKQCFFQSMSVKYILTIFDETVSNFNYFIVIL